MLTDIVAAAVLSAGFALALYLLAGRFARKRFSPAFMAGLPFQKISKRYSSNLFIYLLFFLLLEASFLAILVLRTTAGLVFITTLLVSGVILLDA